MGNRFAQEPNYQQLILAHGILAAITFLFLVPTAILFVRFYPGSGRFAIQIHIWCQILTLFTTTAIVALGVSAVGHNRSLTNPHHGIGIAIYVLVIFQILLGWLSYRRMRRRRKSYAPLRAVLHRWLGRSTALLGIAQVALGLTLYGSPAWLFIVYALIVFAWVALYFVQSYQDEKYRGEDSGSEYSWHGDGPSPRKKTGRFGTIAKTAAAGAGIAYVANKLRKRNDRPADSHHSGSYLNSEKYSDTYSDEAPERKGSGVRKLLGIGALGGLGYYLGRVWGKRRDHDGADSASYVSYTDASEEHTETHHHSHRTQANLPPAPGPGAGILGAAPAAGLLAAPDPAYDPVGTSHRRHESHSSVDSSTDDEDDFSSASPSHKRRNHGIRDTVLGLGALGAARKLFKNRKAKKEDARIEELRRQDMEEERMNRANSQRHRFTGDGVSRHERRTSLTNTDLTPIPGSSVGPGAGAVTGAATGAAFGAPSPYQHPAYGGGSYTVDGQPLPFVPPPPRDPRYVPHSSGSELYAAPDGTPHHRHHGAAEAAAGGVVAAGAGLAAGEALRNRRERSESRRTSGSTGNTPPVSVKLNMHNDGRHVTLRRLTEEEAAADRARDRRRAGRRGSASDGSLGLEDDGGAAGGSRWRRNDVQASPRRDGGSGGPSFSERQRLQASQSRLNANAPGTLNLPTPPPIPGSEGGPGSVTSPATHDGSATEASASNYDRNRRRRRAERAASGQRQRVEFD